MGLTRSGLNKENINMDNYITKRGKLDYFLPPDIQEEIRAQIVGDIYQEAEKIANKVLISPGEESALENRLDDLLTSRWLGFPLMLFLLAFIFWITIVGANLP